MVLLPNPRLSNYMHPGLGGQCSLLQYNYDICDMCGMCDVCICMIIYHVCAARDICAIYVLCTIFNICVLYAVCARCANCNICDICDIFVILDISVVFVCLLLFYTIVAVLQLYHGGGMIYAMRRRKPEHSLLVTQGIFNLSDHIGMV